MKSELFGPDPRKTSVPARKASFRGGPMVCCQVAADEIGKEFSDDS